MASTYPPEGHFLRDLQLHFERRDAGVSVSLPVQAGLCDESGLHAGVLTTAIDIACGSVAGRLAWPDWVATSDISLHVLRPLRAAELVLECAVVRRGRSLIVLQTRVSDPGEGSELAHAGAAFAVLPDRGVGQAGRSGEPPAAKEFPRSRSALDRPVVEKLGIEPVDSAVGCYVMGLSDYVRNTYSALQGGLPGILGELAACGVGASHLGRPVSVRDLRIRYLSQGRVGPFETCTELMRSSADELLARVEILDRGADDRLVAVATCSVG